MSKNSAGKNTIIYRILKWGRIKKELDVIKKSNVYDFVHLMVFIIIISAD